MLVSLPALLVLLDYWPLRRWQDAGRDRTRLTLLLADKLPFCLLAAASCAVTFLVQRHGEAVVPLAALPIGYRVGSACLGYATYLAKTFYPVNLGIYYPFWRGQSYGLSITWGVCLAAGLLAAFACRRRLPWLLVGWAWFLGTLIPVIGLVQVGGQAVADRYTYLPHIGLFLLIFWTGADVSARWPSTRLPLLLAVSAAAVACVGLSIRQASYWHSSAAIFEHTRQVAAPSARLYHLLGDALLEENRADKAGVAYRQAFRLQPADKDVALQLGIIDLRQQHWAEAAEVFAHLTALPDADARVLNNEALALSHLGRNDEATQFYRHALAKDRNYALAHFGLADVLRAEGNAGAAATEYEKGLALRADWVPALAALAWIDAQSDEAPRHLAAVTLARRAVEITQGQDLGSLDALAEAEAVNGHWDGAAEVAQAALALAAKPGAPAGAGALCRERLDSFQHRQLPVR